MVATRRAGRQVARQQARAPDSASRRLRAGAVRGPRAHWPSSSLARPPSDRGDLLGRGLDRRHELEKLAELVHGSHVGIQGEQGVIGAEQGVARADGHADEPVTAGRTGPEGLAELTTLAHAEHHRARGPKGQLPGSLARPGAS